MRLGPEFRQLFHSFEHTAYRLEVRDAYNVSYEHESMRKFLAGEPDDRIWKRSWLDMVREATAAGRRFRRVRVVTLPLTDYSRFGLWGAQSNNAAGEDIRYLPRDKAEAIGLPNHDYWLFDSTKLLHMHFDDDDVPLDHEFVDDAAEIVRHNYWRDAAWHHAIKRDDFAKEQGLGLD
ncbi:MAG TPA: hypothetical protein VFV67_16535 [Actinophytocola sp.]|uniref:DUF6879 family protein n=1 Tax=Actinophytocola sp. TaxID=1872138 RepID=UPI002DB58068|nr:DUF6879 family protein [Actinophytocola sp.]HEU5472263.1 hypothetical protein [Actinophytocola sp.]